MRIIPFTLLIFLLLTACSGVKISQHYDEEVDFNDYKTFFVLPTDPIVDVKINRYDKELILRSIADEMKSPVIGAGIFEPIVFCSMP